MPLSTRGRAVSLTRHISTAQRRYTARPDAFSEGDASELNLPELDVVLERDAKNLSPYMGPEGKPSFTFGLVRDVKAAIDHLGGLFADNSRRGAAALYRDGLAMPGIFNLGRSSFADLIREKDRALLLKYGKAYAAQGPALDQDEPAGSRSPRPGRLTRRRLRCALADDLIIAEKSAKLGLPECLFSLFPGIGALQLPHPQDRRVDGGGDRLQRQIYTATEMQ